MSNLNERHGAILEKKWPTEFPVPKEINSIVCCDVDETYIPLVRDKELGGISPLETYISANAEKKGILLGWITGTNLSSALRKATGYISQSPHFICCSLGTEFYWVKNGTLQPSQSWAERIEKSGYSQENVNKIVDILIQKGMPLQKQPED